MFYMDYNYRESVIYIDDIGTGRKGWDLPGIVI